MPYKDPTDPANIEKARASRRKHYHANKGPYIERAKAERDRIRQIVRDIKEATPCTDCGVQYPYYVMQFDHLDPTLKVSDVTQLAARGNELKVREEIEKCEVVCANCHAERTHQRRAGL